MHPTKAPRVIQGALSFSGLAWKPDQVDSDAAACVRRFGLDAPHSICEVVIQRWPLRPSGERRILEKEQHNSKLEK